MDGHNVWPAGRFMMLTFTNGTATLLLFLKVLTLLPLTLWFSSVPGISAWDDPESPH